MKIEDKQLLLQDLCCRLPYQVKASYYGVDEETTMYDVIDSIYIIGNGTIEVGIGQYGLNIEDIKPYLFPLESMTEEQKLELATIKTYVSLNKNKEYLLFDWLNANHFDYRGLIPMDLALDATNLNIY